MLAETSRASQGVGNGYITSKMYTNWCYLYCNHPTPLLPNALSRVGLLWALFDRFSKLITQIQNNIPDLREKLLWQRINNLDYFRFDHTALTVWQLCLSCCTQETAQPQQLCLHAGLRAFDISLILSGLWALGSFEFCCFLSGLAFSSWT